jgi:DNA-binding transcriptional LysR family regulator
MIKEGMAVGYLPLSSVRAAAATHRLVPVSSLPFGVIKRQIGVFHLDRRPLSEAARDFVGLLRSKPNTT